MEVRGRMLEEMVLMETEKALSGRYQVFKMQLATGEFDMVVYDTEENNCTLCEVRGTNGAARNRFRRVPDAEKYRASYKEQRNGLTLSDAYLKGDTGTQKKSRTASRSRR